MRIRLAFSAALILASPAFAQKPGDRTAQPTEVLGDMAPADPLAEIERLAAAAAAYPLGSLENPIRVGGPEGAQAYVARLRCADGSAPQIGTVAPGGTGGFGSVTRSYPLDCRGGARTALFVDLYHEEHSETRAPGGFTLSAR